ncbi:MAG: NADH peroxidase [Lactobacillales bacterium]|jgi:rubrerythrin|nr:NADH peroxidase [Lactobacillales bacterium]
MKIWVCSICGHVHYGDTPPETCPICGAAADKFSEQLEEDDNENPYLAEHLIGYAKGAPKEIRDAIRENFTAECTEVGMYLAMSRAAYREGLPEIGEFYRRAGLEEADHAARCAELLGEVVTPSSKHNLGIRIKAEIGACNGKYKLAQEAKQLGLDAIADTFFEMAKDEARHGRGFAGLLQRYFGAEA